MAIYGANGNDLSGFSVGRAGDVNGDGYSDVIIGSTMASPNSRTWAGISYIIFGKKTSFTNIDLSNLSISQGYSICGANPYDRSGYSVSGAGDFNGDGYGDIIIGAYGSDPNGNSQAGTSYLLYGKSSGFSDITLSSLTSDKGFKITGEITGDQSGFVVSGAGDINKDGYDDIIIGAHLASPDNRSGAGTCYIIFGKNNGSDDIDLSNLLSSQGFKILGASSGDNFGISVNKVGDVNGDRIDDIIIGAYLADYNGNSNVGISYVIYGKTSGFSNIDLASFATDDGFKMIGASIGDYSGKSVSGAGDFNGDGYDDIVIGAYGANYNDQIDVGIAYLIIDASATAAPTFSPTALPTLSVAPTSSNKINSLSLTAQEEWYNSLSFKLATLSIPLFSFITGWIFREKIAFHIINNWGHSYKLIYNDNKESLPKGEVGLRIAQNKEDNTEMLICKVQDKYIKVEINNGNNNGISEGLHNIIYDSLKQPYQSDSFIFLESEKNQMRDFLLSREFIKFGDLGFIQGNIYKLCLNSYKTIHKEKYAHISRNDQYDLRLSDQNPLHDQVDIDQRQNNIELSSAINANKQSLNLNNDLEIKAISTIKYDSILIHHPQVTDIFRLTKEIAGDTSVSQLIESGKDQNFYNMLEENIKEEGIEATITKLFALDAKPNLISESTPQDTQAVVYKEPNSADNVQFGSSDSLVASMLTAKQVLYHLPVIHYLTQASINYLGYNHTLPNPLDNRAILMSIDLVLGTSAVQFLPAESIMNGMLASTASTASFALRLTASDYLRNQEPAENGFELTAQCATTMLVYTVPGVINYAIAQIMFPNGEKSLSKFDILASGSFGIVQCYSNYKALYALETEQTTTDHVMLFIADAVMLYSLKSHLHLDFSSAATAIISIKNTISVAATIYATDCVSRMVIDVVPQEVKTNYIAPVLNIVSDIADTCYQTATGISTYIIEESNLVIDYIGAINLGEEA